jgi:hypothetical protein
MNPTTRRATSPDMRDADLLALKPRFDEIFDEYVQRAEARPLAQESDEEIDARCNRMMEVIAEVLSHTPITRQGLALQTRAVIMNSYGDWHEEGIASFVIGVVGYLNIDLPKIVMKDLWRAAGREATIARQR